MADLAAMELTEVKVDVDLEFPWMREELMRHLEELADVERQKRTWHAGEASLSYIVHFLFDDTPAPDEALGYYLTSGDEVDAVGAVVGALDAVLRKYGTSLNDPEYTQKPEWSAVTAAAHMALEVLAVATRR
jgi:hypothetical protein